MKQSKFSEAQIVAILGSVCKDKNVENICREHGISPATFYNWKSKYGVMGTDELRRMRELESENARLKKLLADRSLDYDILKEGRSAAAVRILNVLDECSRKVLLSFAATSIKARKLVKLLQELITQKGKPAYIRCDNGPEFISQVLEKFAEENGIEISFSQPSKPTRNGLVERLNSTQRKECLNLKYFKTVQQVQQDLDV